MHTFPRGSSIFVLAEGRLVNLVARRGRKKRSQRPEFHRVPGVTRGVATRGLGRDAGPFLYLRMSKNCIARMAVPERGDYVDVFE